MHPFKLKKSLIIVSMLSAIAASNAFATDVRITFDPTDPIGGLSVGSVLSNQYAAWGVTFAPNAFAGPSSPNGGWATNTDMTIVSSTGTDVGSLGTPALASGNVLGSFGNWLNENGDPSFAMVFSGAGASSVSLDFAGVANPTAVSIYAYSGNTLLGSVIGTSPQTAFTLSFASAAPITRLAVTPGDYNDWVAVDNIRYSTIAAVPEPGTAALAVIGLAAFGLFRIRRQG